MQSTVAYFILMQHACTECMHAQSVCMLNACMVTTIITLMFFHFAQELLDLFSFNCSLRDKISCSIVAILVFSTLELGVSFVTVVSFAFLLNTFSPLGSRHCAIICGMKTMCKMLTSTGSYTL